MQAVESELLGVLTAAAHRAGCNKSLLVVGPRGAGKTLVRPRRGLHAWALRQLCLDVSIKHAHDAEVPAKAASSHAAAVTDTGFRATSQM